MCVCVCVCVRVGVPSDLCVRAFVCDCRPGCACVWVSLPTDVCGLPVFEFSLGTFKFAGLTVRE